jgi:hypothetical protein
MTPEEFQKLDYGTIILWSQKYLVILLEQTPPYSTVRKAKWLNRLDFQSQLLWLDYHCKVVGDISNYKYLELYVNLFYGNAS